MLTHLVKSINWVDVAFIALLVRMIFVGIQNGFISEFFKSIGITFAVFVSLHYYSVIAAQVIQKTHLNWPYWDLVIVVGLCLSVLGIFKLLRVGILILFKVESNHEGFDKYSAGIVSIARGFLVCSLTIFMILLMHSGFLTRMTMRSYSYKLVGHTAVSTYSYLYNNLVGKLFAIGPYNSNAAQVLVVHQ